MGPYGRDNFKTLLLLQITAESFQTFPDFFPNAPHKTTFGILVLNRSRSFWGYSGAFAIFSNV